MCRVVGVIWKGVFWNVTGAVQGIQAVAPIISKINVGVTLGNYEEFQIDTTARCINRLIGVLRQGWRFGRTCRKESSLMGRFVMIK